MSEFLRSDASGAGSGYWYQTRRLGVGYNSRYVTTLYSDGCEVASHYHDFARYGKRIANRLRRHDIKHRGTSLVKEGRP